MSFSPRLENGSPGRLIEQAPSYLSHALLRVLPVVEKKRRVLSLDTGSQQVMTGNHFSCCLVISSP